ncbi:nuclear transport factor 2 family protein [Streptomyces sp. NPDC048290]|uniref:nuclear transport factor 2 family protein n=1 Tax=Streptomyces sp. NPDC048290 TaxID=3155811 RepID=UPI003447A6BE
MTSTTNTPDRTVEALLARLDALESRAAVERLVHLYAQAFDRHDADALRGIWHEGARLDLGAPFGTFTGVDAIIEAAHGMWAQTPHMHHWMSNALIDVDLDGDTATAETALDAFTIDNTTGPTQIGGLYRDRFERRDGRWGIVERSFDLHYLTPIENWRPKAGSETR